MNADKAAAVLRAVEAFRDKHEITAAETIWQTDRVQVAAPELVEQLIDIVGYGDLDDDLDYVAPASEASR